jgi:hypothetical protein
VLCRVPFLGFLGLDSNPFKCAFPSFHTIPPVLHFSLYTLYVVHLYALLSLVFFHADFYSL